MTIPLILLAIASIFTGLIPFGKFVSSDGVPFVSHINWTVAGLSIFIALMGISTAMLFYMKETDLPERVSVSFKGFYTAAFRKFYFDEIYLFVTKKVIFRLISSPIAWFDRHVIDASMNGIAWVTNYSSEKIKGFQSGQIQKYAFVFVSGAIVLAFIFIWLNK
jgi:NADH-quinone oxidoreductase subunit L